VFTVDERDRVPARLLALAEEDPDFVVLLDLSTQRGT